MAAGLAGIRRLGPSQMGDLGRRKLTVEDLILAHAVGVPVSTKADHDQALFFTHDGLINMPSCDQVREDHRSHLAG